MQTERHVNRGVLVGLVFSVILILVHGFIDFRNGSSRADFVLWLFQFIVYFIASLIAANSEYELQKNSNEPTDKSLKELPNAGRGAAMIIWVLLWVYIIARSLLWNDSGMFGDAGVVAFVVFVILDFVVAIALGSWGGSIIAKQHTPANSN